MYISIPQENFFENLAKKKTDKRSEISIISFFLDKVFTLGKSSSGRFHIFLQSIFILLPIVLYEILIYSIDNILLSSSDIDRIHCMHIIIAWCTIPNILTGIHVTGSDKKCRERMETERKNESL